VAASSRPGRQAGFHFGDGQNIRSSVNGFLTISIHHAGSVSKQFARPEIAMYRVLVAILLVGAALQLSGCTGSLRLGSTAQIDSLNWFD
jgi:hypothetical protein